MAVILISVINRQNNAASAWRWACGGCHARSNSAGHAHGMNQVHASRQGSLLGRRAQSDNGPNTGRAARHTLATPRSPGGAGWIRAGAPFSASGSPPGAGAAPLFAIHLHSARCDNPECLMPWRLAQHKFPWGKWPKTWDSAPLSGTKTHQKAPLFHRSRGFCLTWPGGPPCSHGNSAPAARQAESPSMTDSAPAPADLADLRLEDPHPATGPASRFGEAAHLLDQLDLRPQGERHRRRPWWQFWRPGARA